MYQSFIKIWDPKKWLKPEAFISFRQRNHRCVKGWAKGFGLGVVSWWRSSTVVYTAFSALDSLSLVVRMPSTPLLPFLWGVITCWLGGQGGSDCPFCTGYFSSTFNSEKSKGQSGIFWGDTSWPPADSASLMNKRFALCLHWNWAKWAPGIMASPEQPQTGAAFSPKLHNSQDLEVK